jgi:hypothetical protein
MKPSPSDRNFYGDDFQAAFMEQTLFQKTGFPKNRFFGKTGLPKPVCLKPGFFVCN